MKLQLRDYERDRKIVKLYKEGYLYKDIGEMLGITPARVGQLYRRIMKDEGKTKNKRAA